jgi:signal transduction histidine kinase
MVLLYITRSQIEAQGGRIDVTSDVSRGTTFKVYFIREVN